MTLTRLTSSLNNVTIAVFDPLALSMDSKSRGFDVERVFGHERVAKLKLEHANIAPTHCYDDGDESSHTLTGKRKNQAKPTC